VIKKIRIGTRTSQLALWQAIYVKDRLLATHADIEVDIIEIISEGDKTLDIPLASVGGKGLFLKELEQSLLAGNTDIAVHSMKDVTVELPQGLVISTICPREDPRDALVSNQYAALEDMPAGAVVGSCSLRRRCQIKSAFPHLEVRNLRGNVNTRLSRLDNGDYDAIILAAAGLIRLEFKQRIRQCIDTEICLPAVGQGAVGIECREKDGEIAQLLAPLGDRDSSLRIGAERAANARLGGGCHVPLAVYAELQQGQMTVRGMVGEVDGGKVLKAAISGPVNDSEDAQSLGARIAEDLLSQGAGSILAKVYEDAG
jgi:hydroxymethylbilane synthase